MTQNEMVLKYLEEGRLVTSMVAFNLMRCVSLPKRICELKRQGYDIRSTWLNLPSGKNCKSYYLARSSEVERGPVKSEVAGSIPAAPATLSEDENLRLFNEWRAEVGRNLNKVSL